MLDPVVRDILYSAALVAVSGVLFWSLSHVLRRIARVAGGRPSTDRAIRDTVRALWLVVSVGGTLYLTGIANEFSVLTASGVAGLIISLALQATLSNMISGIFLLSDRLVNVGDVIEYSGTKGRVVKVALRNTWLLTDQGLVAVIGNSSLAGGPLVNHSASARFARQLAEDPLQTTTAQDARRSSPSVAARDAGPGPASPAPTTSAAPPPAR